VRSASTLLSWWPASTISLVHSGFITFRKITVGTWDLWASHETCTCPSHFARRIMRRAYIMTYTMMAALPSKQGLRRRVLSSTLQSQCWHVGSVCSNLCLKLDPACTSPRSLIRIKALRCNISSPRATELGHESNRTTVNPSPEVMAAC
jgi:hypothetical protein